LDCRYDSGPFHGAGQLGGVVLVSRASPEARRQRQAAEGGLAPMGLQTAVVDWLDERFELVDAVDGELYRRVPNYAAGAYRYLGAVAVILVAVELITGFLLGLYYVPD